MNAWRNGSTVLCEFFCVRRGAPDDPEGMGSEYPHWECDWHWQPGHPARSRMAILAMAGWLRSKAPDVATSSRDFGRGFMLAVLLLEEKGTDMKMIEASELVRESQRVATQSEQVLGR